MSDLRNSQWWRLMWHALPAYVLSRLCVLAGAAVVAAELRVDVNLADERQLPISDPHIVDGTITSTTSAVRPMLDVLTSWDGLWYMDIVRNGYPREQVGFRFLPQTTGNAAAPAGEEEQRRATGQCQATLAQFDDVYEVVYAGRPIADVPPLDLQPRNMTALHDAMGRLITDAGAELAAMPESQRPGTVVVFENSAEDGSVINRVEIPVVLTP